MLKNITFLSCFKILAAKKPETHKTIDKIIVDLVVKINAYPIDKKMGKKRTAFFHFLSTNLKTIPAINDAGNKKYIINLIEIGITTTSV